MAAPASTSEIHFLRAIRRLGEEGDGIAGLGMVAVLEQLLDCTVLVTLEHLTPVMLLHRRQVPTHELVLEARAEGIVRGQIVLRRPPHRPFGERELLLGELVRPHVAAWLTREADPRGTTGCPAVTARQLEVLALARAGLTNKEIARSLAVSPTTVRKHLENAFARLGTTSRTAAVARAFPAEVRVGARDV